MYIGRMDRTDKGKESSLTMRVKHQGNINTISTNKKYRDDSGSFVSQCTLTAAVFREQWVLWGMGRVCFLRF